MMLTVFSLFFLTACQLPKKPVLVQCHISYYDDECLCRKTSPGSVVKVLPLEECDKATAFSPQEWEKLKNYVHELEAYTQTHCVQTK